MLRHYLCVISSDSYGSFKCQCCCKITIKYHSCKEDYTWNVSISACVHDKNCEIDEYLKNYTCMKSIIDNKAI